MNTRNIESIQPWELLYVFVQLSRSDFLFTDLVSGNRVEGGEVRMLTWSPELAYTTCTSTTYGFSSEKCRNGGI